MSPRRKACQAVFVVLGETPELDRLERCVADPCDHHVVELEWVLRARAFLVQEGPWDPRAE